MRTVLRCCIVILALLMISSCSQKLKKPEWTVEKSAVRIHIKADNKLNLFNNKAHTLYVCFYQLWEVGAFDKMSADTSGIRQMLECRLIDESMVSAHSKVIHPGEDIVLTLDRAERAQHLGIVAGYSEELNGDRVTRRHKYQVFKKVESLVPRIVRCEPCEINLEVALGPGQIEYSRPIPNPKVTCIDECE
jgi:type VI secretion system VasD/TssJ family lipoprotein